MEALEFDFSLPRRAFTLRARLSAGAETVALIGRSGSGKSSLLRTVAGLERPGEGRIACGGEVWFSAESGVDLAPEHRRVGYLPQDYALFPHLSVERNVRFAGGRNRPDLLARMGVERLAAARPATLSGGERQRVALARALARDPRVLLLDEPFAALDAITRGSVRAELAELLSGLGLPVLLVTHAFADAAALAARIGVLSAGRLLQVGSPEDLVAAPLDAEVAALTGANAVPGMAIAAEDGGVAVHLEGGWLRVGAAAGADGALTAGAGSRATGAGSRATGAGSRATGAGSRATGAGSPATGAGSPVTVAVHPWELRLVAPESATLRLLVAEVRPDQGRLLVRAGPFTILVAGSEPGPRVGELVGVAPAAGQVRLFPAPDR